MSFKERKKYRNFYLDIETLEQMKALSQKLGRSQSELLCGMIKHAYDEVFDPQLFADEAIISKKLNLTKALRALEVEIEKL